MEVEQNVEIENEVPVSRQEEQDVGNGDIDVVIVGLNDADDPVETVNINGEEDGEMEKDEILEDGAEREQVEMTGDEKMEKEDYIDDKATVETDEEDIENEIGVTADEEPVHVQHDIVDSRVVDNKDTDDVVNKHIPNFDANKENGGNKEPNNNSIKNSISKFGSPAKKEKGMFKVVQTEKCAACQKTVYAMEKLEMNGHIYHKTCFKCSHCSARLTAKTFSMNEGVIYCVNHFKQLFARKGNYDEGFGRQQYKKKWQDEAPEGATA